MAEFKCYATPAMSIGSRRQSFVYNAIDDMWQTTGRAEIKVNSPDFGSKTVVVPEYANLKDKEKLTKFSFYLFTWDDFKPPSVIRLGKKNAAARIFWEELKNPVGLFFENEICPGHPVNPFDISGETIRGDIVKIPPHSFYRSVTICNDWFIISKYSQFKKHIIQIPKNISSKFNTNEN
jgi:CRISPR type I-D-associated protein Csc1